MPPESVSNTVDGILVGVEPAGQTSASNIFTSTIAEPAPAVEPEARFTEADLQKAREQEKSKVYSRLETLQEQVGRLAAEADARAVAEESARQAAEDAEKAAREAEMDVRDLLSQKEQEWQDRFRTLEQERETERALREKEAAFHEFQTYKQQQVDAAREDILPELIDFVAGDTPEEIASSIAGLRDRSAQIMNNTAEALAAVRRDQRGVQSTGQPLSGPLDNESLQQQITPDAIAGMSMSEYAANRGRFGVTRSATGRGLFS